jgi:mono/diheme cytochrome c family protein
MLALIVLWLLSTPSAHAERPPDAAPPLPTLPDDASETLVRGAWLYQTASCVGCHSPPFSDAEHLGGGRDLPTVFGTFYAPNISPHPDHGIGGWSEDDFVRAMRHGRAPDGHRYWPTFPYMAYTQLTDDDLHALWVYLQAGAPSEHRPPDHEVRLPYRLPGLLALWRAVAFRPGPLPELPDADPVVARGRYLVHAVSYCDQCHTPRNRLGVLNRRHTLAGGANPGKGDVHPNLTPDPTHGLGSWSLEAVAHYLATAEPPDGQGPPEDDIMAEKVRDSFSRYDDDDRLAIAAYLASLPPDDFDPTHWGPARRQTVVVSRDLPASADAVWHEVAERYAHVADHQPGIVHSEALDGPSTGPGARRRVQLDPRGRQVMIERIDAFDADAMRFVNALDDAGRVPLDATWLASEHQVTPLDDGRARLTLTMHYRTRPRWFGAFSRGAVRKTLDSYLDGLQEHFASP